jgi:hypothetical protein
LISSRIPTIEAIPPGKRRDEEERDAAFGVVGLRLKERMSKIISAPYIGICRRL